MHSAPRRSVFRRWLEVPTSRPIRTRLERLEDRVNPTISIDAGGLRFIADTFQLQGGEHVATSGVVSIGYVPAGNENFLGLVQVDLGSGTGAGKLAVNTGTATFGVTNGKMALTVVSAGKTAAPIPVWHTPDTTTRVNFPIATLDGAGVTLSDAKSSAITVASVDFTLNLIEFVNPGGGDTSDAKVQMQGNVSFDQLPATNGLNGAKFEVNGINYVVADKSGIILTGLEATRSIPTGTTFGGMDVSGTVTIGYSNPDHLFTFGGGVELSSSPQGEQGKVGFDGVGAELNFTITEANGKLDVRELGFGIDGKFHIFDLNVSTIAGEPFAFQYDLDAKQFEISGGLQAEFRGNTVGVSFGNAGNPGLIVVDGEVTQLAAQVTADFKLFDVSVTTSPSNGLNFEYDRAKDQFEMWGGLTLNVPTTNTNTQITAQMGTSATDPGLVIVGGELTALDLAVSGKFDVYGLALGVKDGGVKWTKAADPADDELLIFGDYTADFKVFQTDVQLGTDSSHPGVTIAGGKFVVDAVTFELENADFGVIQLNDLKVSYTAVGNSFDLGVKVNVGLPGGWSAGGDFEFVNGRLDSITVVAQNSPGLPIADTGLFLTEMEASVRNLENPSQIVVSGRVDVVFGETINMLGREVNLFHAEGQFTVDADELILDCDVQIGAYSTDGGNTWQGVIGQADGKLTLDWQDNVYALHLEADGLLGFFDVEGDLVFAAGKDIQFLAEAEVVVPEWVPFIGGDKLGGFGFYFEHVWPQPGLPSSTTFAAWINLDIIWTVTVGFEVFIDGDGNKHTSLIGGSAVGGFEQSVQHPTDRPYTFRTDLSSQIPAAATYAVVSADWSRSAPGVTFLDRPTFRVQRVFNGQTQIFTQDQFAAAGISLVSDARFNGPTSAAIQIVGSTTNPDAPILGDYTLLVDIETEGANPFPHFPNPNPPPGQDFLDVEATYHVPKPTFGPQGVVTPYVPTLPTPTPTGTFPVTLSGTVDGALLDQAKLSLYRVRTNDPFQRGVLVATGGVNEIDPPQNGVNWQATIDVPIDALYPVGYTLYAVFNDGFNTPIQTAASAVFTPVFAVQGTVQNQNDDPEFAWDVYLDYNRNNQHDATEPITKTNRGGFYGFTKSFDASTGWNPVPVNQPFDVQLILPPQSKTFAPFNAATPVTYSGQSRTADYALREMSAIKGNVFVDLLNDGNAAHGQGAAGALVYIDANGNGQRDPGEPTATANSAGDYAFANVAAGTYKVALDVTSLSLTDPTAAYAVSAGTVGNQTANLTLGMTFTVDEPTVVTSLGVFDSGGDGFGGTMTATLYDATTKAAVAALTFTPGAPGTLQGGTRFLPLADPITLLPGFKGVIAASGFSARDPWGSAEPAPWKLDAGANQLEFTGTGVAGPGGQYPSVVGGNTVTNPYAAGSFLFREAPWAQSSPGATPYTVTIDNSGFDLVEKKDFGVLPPAFISGNVSGHALANGQPEPGSEPLTGWTVQLLADATYARINAGGGAVGNYNTDTHFSGGATGGTTAEIDTSRVFNPAPQQVYQSNRYGVNRTAFSYPIGGQTPGEAVGVRLHFAETSAGAPGERLFDVTINGQRVLSGFDVYEAAGGKNTAVVQAFDTFADANGVVTIEFTPGQFGDPFVCGVELSRPGAVAATTTTDAQGNYVFTRHTPGEYTVQQVPPTGWRQVSPYHSDLQFATSELPASVFGAEPVVADFNGDGYADFAIAATDGPEFGGFVQVYYNLKNNTFSAADRYDASAPGGPWVVAADLNGDRLIDLAVLAVPDEGDSSLGAFINTGNNAPGQRYQFVPNFWTLPSAFTPIANTLAYPTRADLNGDELDDLLLGFNTAGDTSASVLVLLNAAQASARTVTEYALPQVNLGNESYQAGPIVVADFNGDGKQDVFVNGGMYSIEYSNLNLALGDGKGGLAPWQSYDLENADGDTLGPAGAGDVTGVGAPSVVVTSPSEFRGNWAYYTNYAFNRGDGTLGVQFGTDVNRTPLAPIPTELLVMDANGDLKPDLVYLLAGGPGAQGVLAYLNVGAAPYYELANPVRFPFPVANFAAEDFAAADVNNDGLLDLLVTGVPGGLLLLNQSPQNEPGVPVFLGAGAVHTGTDFVNAQKPTQSAVHGQVYEDVNRNGRRDSAEAGQAGTVVFADFDADGAIDPGEPTSVTVAGGLYTLTGLPDGTFPVVTRAEEGWRTPGVPAEVTIRDGSVSQLDLGRTRRLVVPVGDRTAVAGELLSVPVATTAAAARRGLQFTLEGKVPAGASIDGATGLFRWAPPATLASGEYRFTVRVRDPFDTTFTEREEFVVSLTGRPVTRLLAVGAGDGGGSRVVVYNSDHTERFRFEAFGPGYSGGGVRVATGDVNGDGFEDVIAAAGPGWRPRVKVFDGRTGDVLARFDAFGPAHKGGLNVAAGDVNGDGRADIVVGAGAGRSRVKVFDGETFAELARFEAFGPGYGGGGVRVATGDVDADGFADIVAASGPGWRPLVKVFGGKDRAVLARFDAFSPRYVGGVDLAAGDADGDGFADVVAGHASGRPRVRVFAGAELGLDAATFAADFLAGSPTAGRGVRVAAKVPAAGGKAEIATALGGVGTVTGYRLGDVGEPPVTTFTLDPFAGFTGGVFLG